jgi:uncharacterized membrane protein YeaQ/YmgE (transglycosylase-associated protein family)
MLLGFIGWVALGLLVGFIASKTLNLRGDDPNMGIAFGGAGAFIGGIAYSMISGNPVTAFNVMSLIIAGVGAVVVLIVWHVIMRRHSFVRH